jgi:hypothetical protein
LAAFEVKAGRAQQEQYDDDQRQQQLDRIARGKPENEKGEQNRQHPFFLGDRNERQDKRQ